MSGNGNGYNGRYTAQQFINAIPGTGGIVSELAERVGCRWHTAKKYIDKYVTVQEAWKAERNRITDIAKCNIVEAIREGNQGLSKWWLQVMRREEFDPPQRQEITGAEGGALEIITRRVAGRED